MTRTVKKPMMKTSVGSLFYAHNTQKGEFDPSKFTEIIESPVIKNVGVSEEAETTTVRASGQIYDTVSKTSGTDLQIEVVAFDPSDLATLRGETIEENGLIFGGGDSERPFIAIGFPKIKQNGKVEYRWYPKCKLTENTDDVETSEESFSEQTDTLTFQAMPFNANGDVVVKLDTETTEGTDVDLDDFFAQVITKAADLTKGA